MIDAAMMMVAMLVAGVPAADGSKDEREITIAGPQGPLAGTFRSAGSSAPVVVIIPGSGPTDRDGNNPLGVTAAPYRLLAAALGRHGVSTIRIDKRGLFKSRDAIADANKVTIADYAADSHGWAREARRLAGTDCTWLAGHSEGGLIALAAAQDATDLCGIILIAAPGRPLGIAMREQLRANPANAPILDQALAAIGTVERGETVDAATLPAALQPLFNASVQPFLRDLLSHDPAKLAAGTKLPLLIVQAGQDLQIGKAEGEALYAARPDSTLAVIEEANHVLKVVPDADRVANLKSYGDRSLPLAPGIAEAIARFVHAGGK